MSVRLVDRFPVVDPADLVAGLVPPPTFEAARFSTYLPQDPSQEAAVRVLESFLAAPPKRLLRKAPDRPSGIYLDGGFGVGKTHLLASLWHASEGPKAYCTFVELTHLVGALTFAGTVEVLSQHRLLCIDEFELDDPGDTVLVSTLLGKLADAGVRLACTSNTLPDALGEGRFAASDFTREIQGLAARFVSVRVDGGDYRHRGLPEAPRPLSRQELLLAAGEAASYDGFEALLAHLAELHPSRYGALLDGVEKVCLDRVVPVTDQNQALRLVVLVDRIYDRSIPVATSGVPLDQLFPEELLRGGYRKKYLRALSRLVALSRAS